MSTDKNQPIAAENRRPKAGELTREAVTECATDLFLRNGYEATGVGAIAAELGITKAAIYHHVPSKETLLNSAIDAALEALDEVIARCRQLDAPAGEKVRFLARGTAIALCQQPKNVALLLRLRGNTPAQLQALERRRAYTAYTQELLGLCAAEGSLNPDINPAVGSRILFGAINSTVEWYDPQGAMSPEELANTIELILLNGFLKS